jgi:hypothetical protein
MTRCSREIKAAAKRKKKNKEDLTMATQEIKSTQWNVFCDKFLELHRGALMSLTKIEPSGRRVEVFTDIPLTNVWMENGGCNDRIFLNFERDGKREITHEIIDPIHMKLREESGGKKALQIDAENGSTLLLFRSGHLQELREFAEQG